MKRTAMKRASFESVRAWKERSKPMRRRSVKMAAEYVKRRAFVAKYLADNPLCMAHLSRDCTGIAVDVHEVIRRSHGGALYPGQEGKRETQYMALCRACHDLITTNPRVARAFGMEVK